MLKFNWTKQREVGEITSRDQRDRNMRRKHTKDERFELGELEGEREKDSGSGGGLMRWGQIPQPRDGGNNAEPVWRLGQRRRTS
jgi:hypothetical protein